MLIIVTLINIIIIKTVDNKNDDHHNRFESISRLIESVLMMNVLVPLLSREDLLLFCILINKENQTFVAALHESDTLESYMCCDILLHPSCLSFCIFVLILINA